MQKLKKLKEKEASSESMPGSSKALDQLIKKEKKSPKAKTPVKKKEFAKSKSPKSLSRKRVDHVVKQEEDSPEVVPPIPKKGFCDIEKLDK